MAAARPPKPLPTISARPGPALPEPSAIALLHALQLRSQIVQGCLRPHGGLQARERLLDVAPNAHAPRPAQQGAQLTCHQLGVQLALGDLAALLPQLLEA